MKKLLFFSLLAVLALPVWAQGTAKPGVITVGFIPAEDSRAMVRQSQAILAPDNCSRPRLTPMSPR